MTENNVVEASSPELAFEIETGLKTLGKQGYSVHVRDGEASGTRLIIFQLGENEQTLEFKNDEWHNQGAVSRAIVEHLNI